MTPLQIPDQDNNDGSVEDTDEQPLNNIEKNDELVTFAVQIMAVFAWSVFCLPLSYIFIKYRDEINSQNQSLMFLQESMLFTVIYVLMPTIIYLKNPNLKRHVKNEIFVHT